MPKICEYETCRAYANYGEFYGKPLRCKKHKGDYTLVSQLCREENCKMRPTYNKEGESKALYCLEHKLEGMVNVKSKTCEHPGCKITSSYNYEGLKAMFCFEHKTENMILVRGRFCIFNGCKSLPNYNYLNENKPLYCGKHKAEGMTNVTSKKCIFESCNKFPLFNYFNESNGLFCFEHKLENMIDIKHKKCKIENCSKRPNFNYNGNKNGLYCFEHRLENMVDVTHKLCLYNNCFSRATCNYLNEKNGLYCFEHKLENMINITDKKCKAGFCLGTKANRKYKGYCASCYRNLFPTDPLTLQIRCKTKEIAIRDFINLNFEGFQHDKPLWSGNCDCTHRRKIDHRKLIGNTLLCIETDENQHKGYDKSDEEIRYDDLYMLHSGKFIFIRFNPDKFKDKNGKSLNPMLYTRLPILKEEIEKQIKRIETEENKELLEIIKLYYDEIKN